MKIEQESTGTAFLTGRMGFLVETRNGHEWRATLMLSGKMGDVTRDGEPWDRVPVWLQRKMARATIFMHQAYAMAVRS